MIKVAHSKATKLANYTSLVLQPNSGLHHLNYTPLLVPTYHFCLPACENPVSVSTIAIPPGKKYAFNMIAVLSFS